jgi:hypothetical protein
MDLSTGRGKGEVFRMQRRQLAADSDQSDGSLDIRASPDRIVRALRQPDVGH